MNPSYLNLMTSNCRSLVPKLLDQSFQDICMPFFGLSLRLQLCIQCLITLEPCALFDYYNVRKITQQ